MSEFEYVESLIANISFVRAAAMDFVTVFFAYCLAAHLVGSQLQRIVAVSMSAIYSLFLINPFLGMLAGMNSQIRMQAIAHSQYPDSAFIQEASNSSLVILMVVAPPLLGWLASLLYLHVFVRTSNSGDA